MRAARSQPRAMSFTRLGPEQHIRETEAGGRVTPRASRGLLSVQRRANMASCCHLPRFSFQQQAVGFWHHA